MHTPRDGHQREHLLLVAVGMFLVLAGSSLPALAGSLIVSVTLSSLVSRGAPAGLGVRALLLGAVAAALGVCAAALEAAAAALAACARLCRSGAGAAARGRVRSAAGARVARAARACGVCHT